MWACTKGTAQRRGIGAQRVPSALQGAPAHALASGARAVYGARAGRSPDAHAPLRAIHSGVTFLSTASDAPFDLTSKSVCAAGSETLARTLRRTVCEALVNVD